MNSTAYIPRDIFLIGVGVVELQEAFHHGEPFIFSQPILVFLCSGKR